MVALSFTTYLCWGSIRHLQRAVVVSLCMGTPTVWTVPIFKGTVSGSSTLCSSTQPLPTHRHPLLPVRRSDCLPSGCQRGWKVRSTRLCIVPTLRAKYNLEVCVSKSRTQLLVQSCACTCMHNLNYWRFFRYCLSRQITSSPISY